jgi:hypothetical protein
MRRCTQRNADGAPCSGKAVRGTDPPRCMAHCKAVREGAPYRPRVRHGYYATQRKARAGVDVGRFVREGGVQAEADGGYELHPADPRTVTTDTAIAGLVDKMKVMHALIQDDEQARADLVRLLELYSTAASRLSRMVRDRHYIEGQALDERLELGLEEALDALAERVALEL